MFALPWKWLRAMSGEPRFLRESTVTAIMRALTEANSFWRLHEVQQGSGDTTDMTFKVGGGVESSLTVIVTVTVEDY